MTDRLTAAERRILEAMSENEFQTRAEIAARARKSLGTVDQMFHSLYQRGFVQWGPTYNKDGAQTHRRTVHATLVLRLDAGRLEERREDTRVARRTFWIGVGALVAAIIAAVAAVAAAVATIIALSD